MKRCSDWRVPKEWGSLGQESVVELDSSRNQDRQLEPSDLISKTTDSMTHSAENPVSLVEREGVESFAAGQEEDDRLVWRGEQDGSPVRRSMRLDKGGVPDALPHARTFAPSRPGVAVGGGRTEMGSVSRENIDKAATALQSMDQFPHYRQPCVRGWRAAAHGGARRWVH